MNEDVGEDVDEEGRESDEEEYDTEEDEEDPFEIDSASIRKDIEEHLKSQSSF